MSPVVLPALADLGVFCALLGFVTLVLLVWGWSLTCWVDTLRHRRDLERQRLLLAELYQLEVCVGGEFPQVAATVDYVRRFVLAEEPPDLVVLRTALRLRYGGASEREKGRGC